MYELWLVLEREFVQRVRSRSFLLSTALVPLFMAAIFGIPIAMDVMGEGGHQRIVVVDEAPPGIGGQVVASLAAERQRRRDASFAVDHVRAPLGGVRDSLNAAILAESVDAYLWLPPGVVDEGRVAYRARNVTDFELQQRLRIAVNDAVQGARLTEAGLEMGEIALLLRPVQLDASRVTRDGDDGAGAAASFLVALFSGMLLYFLIFFYGVQVMQSVQEEKTNRISEVLVSSMRASHLMMGKVIGVGGAALLQVAIWAAFAGVLISQRARVLGAFGASDGMLDGPGAGLIDAASVASVLLFGILGFFLYAALFAAAGAAAASSEDAQRFTFPLIMPLLIPIVLQQQIVRDPQGTLATVFGLIPFTSPIVMPMRLGTGAIGGAQVALALLLLVAGVLALGWAAGKIYRVGILATGQRAGLRDLVRWLRAA